MTREEEIKQAYLQWASDIECSEFTIWKSAAEWADEHPKSLWISVKERLPEDDRVVLCLFGGLIGCPVVRVGQYTDADKIWYIYGWGNPDVTHWMPIPELPTTK